MNTSSPVGIKHLAAAGPFISKLRNLGMKVVLNLLHDKARKVIISGSWEQPSTLFFLMACAWFQVKAKSSLEILIC